MQTSSAADDPGARERPRRDRAASGRLRTHACRGFGCGCGRQPGSPRHGEPSRRRRHHRRHASTPRVDLLPQTAPNGAHPSESVVGPARGGTGTAVAASNPRPRPRRPTPSRPRPEPQGRRHPDFTKPVASSGGSAGSHPSGGCNRRRRPVGRHRRNPCPDASRSHAVCAACQHGDRGDVRAEPRRGPDPAG